MWGLSTPTHSYLGEVSAVVISGNVVTALFKLVWVLVWVSPALSHPINIYWCPIITNKKSPSIHIAGRPLH